MREGDVGERRGTVRTEEVKHDGEGRATERKEREEERRTVWGRGRGK